MNIDSLSFHGCRQVGSNVAVREMREARDIADGKTIRIDGATFNFALADQ